MKNTTHFQSLLKKIIVCILICITIIIFFYISKVTYPFIIAFLIAMAINPIINFLEIRLKLPRFLSILLTIGLFLSMFSSLFVFIIIELISGAEYLTNVLPHSLTSLIEYIKDLFVEKIMPILNQSAAFFRTLDEQQQNAIILNIEDLGKTFTTNIGLVLSSFLGKIPTFFSWLPNFATSFIISILAAFFISKDWYKIKFHIKKILPGKMLNSVSFVLHDLKFALLGFVRAQMTLITITIITILIGLIILDVEYAITIAFLLGFIDLIPYVGTGLVFIPWIGYEYLNGDSHFAIGLIILYLVIIIQRQVLEPKILSSNIGIHPLATLIAVFIGYKLFGLLGLLLGPFVLILITTIIRTKLIQELTNFIFKTP